MFFFYLTYKMYKVEQFTLLYISLRPVRSFVMKRPASGKAISASTDVGGTDSMAVVILIICLLSFLQSLLIFQTLWIWSY